MDQANLQASDYENIIPKSHEIIAESTTPTHEELDISNLLIPPSSNNELKKESPLSFQEITELVRLGKPIPGMKNIPLILQSNPPATESILRPIKKPWLKLEE